MALLNGFDFIVPVTDVVLSTAASWAQNARGKERFHNSPQSAWRHRELRRTARGGPGALGKAAAVHLRRRRSAAAGVVGQQQPAPADQRARRHVFGSPPVRQGPDSPLPFLVGLGGPDLHVQPSVECTVTSLMRRAVSSERRCTPANPINSSAASRCAAIAAGHTRGISHRVRRSNGNSVTIVRKVSPMGIRSQDGRARCNRVGRRPSAL